MFVNTRPFLSVGRCTSGARRCQFEDRGLTTREIEKENYFQRPTVQEVLIRPCAIVRP